MSRKAIFISVPLKDARPTRITEPVGSTFMALIRNFDFCIKQLNKIKINKRSISKKLIKFEMFSTIVACTTYLFTIQKTSYFVSHL